MIKVFLDIHESWHGPFLVTHQFQYLIVLFFVKLMHRSKSKFIKTPLFDNPSLAEIHVTIFLDLVIVFCSFHLVTSFLNVLPATFHLQCIIEWKLFMHHSVTMISPHVIKTHTGKLTAIMTQINIASVCVAKYSTPMCNMLLHERQNNVRTFLFYYIYEHDLGVATKHSEHPSD